MTHTRDILKEAFKEFLKEEEYSGGAEFDILERTEMFNDFKPDMWLTRATDLMGIIPAESSCDRWHNYLISIRNHYSPEPPPVKGKKEVLPELIKDLQKREKVGIKKYGTKLMTDNGRDPMIDAYQELCDLCVYLKQFLMERETIKERENDRSL